MEHGDWKCRKRKVRHNVNAGVENDKITKMRHKIIGVEMRGNGNAEQNCRNWKMLENLRRRLHEEAHVKTMFSEIDTARSHACRVYMKLPIERPSVDMSVCQSRHSAAARRCGGFAAVIMQSCGPQPGDIDRFLRVRPALSSKCEQCHVVRWRRKLNTYLL